MTIREQHLTNVLRSRGVAVIIAVAALWMSRAAMAVCSPLWTDCGHSLLTDHCGGWRAGMPDISFIANALLILATAVGMVVLNRRFNILRSLSVFFAAFFIFATCAMLPVSVSLTTAPLLTVSVIACMLLMFSVYARRRSSRRVFLVFTILSAASLVEYTMLLYVPVFLIGLTQVKLFKFKNIVASLLGLVTPPWIVWGLGLAPLPSVPHFYITPPAALAEVPGGLAFLVTVATTMLIDLILGMVNIVRIIGFNARSRAFHGVIMTVGVATSVFAIVNFSNLPFYVMLITAATAFQIGFFFRFSMPRKGYILILSLLAIYTGLFIWQLNTV